MYDARHICAGYRKHERGGGQVLDTIPLKCLDFINMLMGTETTFDYINVTILISSVPEVSEQTTFIKAGLSSTPIEKVLCKNIQAVALT